MTDKPPNWTREALREVRGIKTSCRDFICAACEWIAQCRGHGEVELEDVGTVLAWIASTEVKENEQ
jgi:hypothetical protein